MPCRLGGVSAPTPFDVAFGRLIAAYRAGPAGEAGAAALLAESARLLAAAPARIEAGLIRSGEYDVASVRSHLIRRQVEVLTLAAGVPADALAELARSLGGSAPLPELAGVTYELVTQIVPLPAQSTTPARAAEPPPLVLMRPEDYAGQDDRERSSFDAEVSALNRAVAAAERRGSWTEALHAAQALVRLTGRVPEQDRRTVAITARRALSRPLLTGIIAYAVRTPEEQPRAAEVLQWRGGEAAELMLERVRETESPAPHRFLLEALGRMPEAVPLLLPLLASPRWHEVRHAAEILGRQLAAEAQKPLRALLDHPEPRVRAAALDALSRYPGAVAVDALRKGLGHESPATRRDAAEAIGRRGVGALAMALFTALEGEKDLPTWRAMLTALSRIESPEAATALAGVALQKKGLLSRAGFALPQRLEAVAVAAASPTRAARQALARVAREGEGQVGAAARGELERRTPEDEWGG